MYLLRLEEPLLRRLIRPLRLAVVEVPNELAVSRYWFHFKMLVMVVISFTVLTVTSGWGNELLNVWIEPPCSDGAALDGECRLESSRD